MKVQLKIGAVIVNIKPLVTTDVVNYTATKDLIKTHTVDVCCVCGKKLTRFLRDERFHKAGQRISPARRVCGLRLVHSDERMQLLYVQSEERFPPKNMNTAVWSEGKITGTGGSWVLE